MLVEYPHRVTIEQPTVTNDVTTWSTFAANVPASIEPGKGREFWEAQKVNAELSTVVKMRYVAGVLPTMRAKFGSRIFNIDEPPRNSGERNKELVLYCVEVF